MTQKAKEVKFGVGYGKQPRKTFKVNEVDGLIKVLNRIEASNPKIDLKIDYWLSKNKKALIEDMTAYVKLQNDVVKKYAVIYTNEEFKDKEGKLVEFLVIQGKDENDTLLRDGNVNFKLTEAEGKPLLDYIANPSWELEIPAKEEGGEVTKKQLPYQIKYKTAEDETACDKELNELADNYQFTTETWLLKEENLEGVNVVWAGKEQENVSQFKHLLYENLIG